MKTQNIKAKFRPLAIAIGLGLVIGLTGIPVANAAAANSYQIATSHMDNKVDSHKDGKWDSSTCPKKMKDGKCEKRNMDMNDHNDDSNHNGDNNHDEDHSS